LNELRNLSINAYHEFNEYKFRIYKNLLEDQLEVIEISRK
jgi:hypothetical protein